MDVYNLALNQAVVAYLFYASILFAAHSGVTTRSAFSPSFVATPKRLLRWKRMHGTGAQFVETAGPGGVFLTI